MKIHFRFFLSHVKLAKTQEKRSFIEFYHPILLLKTRQRCSVTYDVIDKLRRLSLSKCFPVLCHKLIYGIAIFHSINRETCYKIYYDMYSLSQRPHMCGHCPGTLLYFLQNDRGQSRSHIHSSSAGQLSEKKTKMTVESYIYILLLS